jgi:DNA-binding transcriptional LysR family regulator
VVVLACEYAGFQPRMAHSSDDFRAVVALAGAGAGVALVPRSALRGMELTGVVVRPVDGVAATRRVFAAVRRGAEDHPLIRPALDALRTAAGRIDPAGAADRV